MVSMQIGVFITSSIDLWLLKLDYSATMNISQNRKLVRWKQE